VSLLLYFLPLGGGDSGLIGVSCASRAGREVTAMGVLSDLIKVLERLK